MTIGYMIPVQRLLAASLTALALLSCAPCAAADITVNALGGVTAMLSFDAGMPRMLSVGETTPEGVKQISATSEAAVVEYKGRRHTLAVGQGTRVVPMASADAAGRVTLIADSRGHFIAN